MYTEYSQFIMADGEEVSCPVCNKPFPLSRINSHIDKCLNGDVRANTDRPTTNKHVTKNENSLGFQLHKRRRPEDIISEEPTVNIDTNNRTNGSSHGQLSTKRPKLMPSETTIQNFPKHDDNEESSSSGNQMGNQRILQKPDVPCPLAEKMRPSTLDGYFGQEELLGQNSYLKKVIESGIVPSLIFWGPPGCGKTTLANIIAKRCKTKSNIRFIKLSACASNVSEVKKVITEAKNEQKLFKRKTILFMDEIHRFNKLQQDTFLPVVENGTITLLGATTENPSFQLNSALLSRCKVIVLNKLAADDIENILRQALEKINVTIAVSEDGKDGDTRGPCITEKAVKAVAALCDGDARSALNAIEIAFASDTEISHDGTKMVTVEQIKDILQRNSITYDRVGEEHYNCISALHKSMRGSDANAALYWLARMLLGGEDPLYIARRLVQFSSEDVGLADPNALVLAVSTFQACINLGMPECQLNLAECVIYLARAPKSTEVFFAYENAKSCIMQHKGPLPGVPYICGTPPQN